VVRCSASIELFQRNPFPRRVSLCFSLMLFMICRPTRPLHRNAPRSPPSQRCRCFPPNADPPRRTLNHLPLPTTVQRFLPPSPPGHSFKAGPCFLPHKQQTFTTPLRRTSRPLNALFMFYPQVLARAHAPLYFPGRDAFTLFLTRPDPPLQTSLFPEERYASVVIRFP